MSSADRAASLRQLGSQLFSQLPTDIDDAREVVRNLSWLVENYMAQRDLRPRAHAFGRPELVEKSG